MKKNPDLQKIGNYIKELREKKKISQKELADKLNIDNRTISKWENGTSAVDIIYIVKLADELNTTPEEILLGSNNPKDLKKSKLIEYVKKEKIKVFIIFIILLSVISLTSFIIVNKIKKDNIIDYYQIKQPEDFNIEAHIISNNKKSYLIINNIYDINNLMDYVYRISIIIDGEKYTSFTYNEEEKFNIENFHEVIIVNDKIDLSKDNGILIEYYKDDFIEFISIPLNS